MTQIVLRWFMQRNIVAIPMTTNSEHMKENIDIFDFVLTDEEMKQIAELDRGTGMGGFGMPADAQAFPQHDGMVKELQRGIKRRDQHGIQRSG